MMGKSVAQNVLFNFLPFIEPKIKAQKRIGPHNKDIISIITGSLLGAGTLYNVGGKCRLRIEQKSEDYIYFL